MRTSRQDINSFEQMASTELELQFHLNFILRILTASERKLRIPKAEIATESSSLWQMGIIDCE
jgi:hypothetical protein